MDELSETWPPEFSSDKLAGLEITWIAGSLMVVTVGKDGMTEGVLRGDVDTAFVG